MSFDDPFWSHISLGLSANAPDKISGWIRGGTMTERGVIRLSQFINHPPAKVWKALTDPEIHAKWWAAGDVKAVVGHRFTLDKGPWGQQLV
jgi:hypothetical protein